MHLVVIVKINLPAGSFKSCDRGVPASVDMCMCMCVHVYMCLHVNVCTCERAHVCVCMASESIPAASFVFENTIMQGPISTCQSL